MPPQLVALTEGPNLLLDKPILLLGRHQECDIQLVSRKVSRRHCCIAQVDDHLVVRDLGSTNGVRINGVRVLEGKLRPGDELTIGNYRYRVHWEARPAAKPARGTALKCEPASVPAAGNALLESGDVPVPLPEPAAKHPTQLEVGPAAPAAPPSPENDVEQPMATEPSPRSLVLPDKIDLAPISDVRPTKNPPGPPG